MADLMGMVWANWRSVRPPAQIVVFGMYDRDPDNVRVYRGRTCKHGCCWDCGHGSMTLPDKWAKCDDQDSELTGIRWAPSAGLKP